MNNIRALRLSFAMFVTLMAMSSGCDSNPGSSSQKAVAFDAAKWRAGDEKDRGSMVHDLVRQEEVLLRGRIASQIEALLGKPDFQSAELWVYIVDVGETFCDSPWTYDLQIKFDKQGAVTDVELTD